MQNERYAADYVPKGALDRCPRDECGDMIPDALEYATAAGRTAKEAYDRACRFNVYRGECYHLRRELRLPSGEWETVEYIEE